MLTVAAGSPIVQIAQFLLLKSFAIENFPNQKKKTSHLIILHKNIRENTFFFIQIMCTFTLSTFIAIKAGKSNHPKNAPRPAEIMPPTAARPIFDTPFNLT